MNETKKYFIKRYQRLFPNLDFDLICSDYKIKEKEIIYRLKQEKAKLEKIPYLKLGYYYESEFSLGSTPEYLQGYYFLQESSSQIPVEILSPRKEDKVLDMCAAPGSKTTQIAQLMRNEGVIVALDNTKWRLNALRNNLERLGIKNVILYNKDARFATDIKQKFSKILLDAPCSGNFLTDSKWFNKRTIEDIKERTKLQKELLKTAVSILEDEGTLIYSTCTLEPEENEMIIDWALSTLDIKLEKIEFPVGIPGLTKIFDKEYDPELSKCLRIIPDEHRIPPFFVAKIRKK